MVATRPLVILACFVLDGGKTNTIIVFFFYCMEKNKTKHSYYSTIILV